ncbi:tRNA (adenine(22)-N(1))-methyltransferase [Erysipelothrix anatis]|uniref:tRNA (adenine(22)-N(1))-methyltransferase n=1 Tax=Erysipelothrix anatis TaxID=2683713 RepID=UPI00135ACFC5|nr:class I SAM-dependent methyltransferase [Erysipelothrix anatis]
MKLSQRLQKLLDMVPKGARMADIGTDHGLLMIKCLEDGICDFAYGLDIAPMPLDAARQNVAKHGYEDVTELVLSDGLKSFNGLANCYVAAGMGAETIWEIIKEYQFEDNDVILIQSNTKNAWFRDIVSQSGFTIVDEAFLMERDIPVFMMKLQKTGIAVKLSYEERTLGPILMKNLDTDYTKYLIGRKEHLDRIKQHDSTLEEEFQLLNKIV